MRKGFCDTLQSKEIGERDGRVVHRLTAPLIYAAADGRIFEVPDGFECDLASVPRVPIIWLLWGDKAHREGVLHDYLYRRDNPHNLTRHEADSLFCEAIKSDSPSHPANPCWISGPMWAGVRLGGGSAYHRMAVMDSFPLDVCYEELNENLSD